MTAEFRTSAATAVAMATGAWLILSSLAPAQTFRVLPGELERPSVPEGGETVPADQEDPEALDSKKGGSKAQAAPGFTLESIKGGKVALSDLKGKVVILEFWATWCPPCKKMIPKLNDLHDRYASQGLVILALNLREEKDEVKAFAKEEGIKYTVLLDPGEVAEKYGVAYIPTAFLVDVDGKLVNTGSHPGEEEFEKAVQEQLKRVQKSKKK